MTGAASSGLRLDTKVWRAVFHDADPLAAVSSPEGRFHHAGQQAVYTSLTPEGCVTAIHRYLRADDPPRLLVPLRVSLANVADLRNRTDVSAVWQDIRAGGAPSPTWAFSDAARAGGAQGLLYSSRSTPAQTHLVIFDPACISGVAGPSLPFSRR